MRKQHPEQEWTALPNRTQKLRQQKEEEERERKLKETPKRPDPIYEEFPHPRSPHKDDLPYWVGQEAYFVMKGEGSTRVLLHKECGGTLSSALKVKMHQDTQEHPVIVMDLSACPVLMRDDEWVHTILSLDERYRQCTCSYARYILDDPEVPCEFYRLTMPYFYLCNMNKRGEEGFTSAALVNEEMYRSQARKKGQQARLREQIEH